MCVNNYLFIITASSFMAVKNLVSVFSVETTKASRYHAFENFVRSDNVVESDLCFVGDCNL